jgi:uncharacterized BrkB/YihY/UPF0761 family membrane protein
MTQSGRFMIQNDCVATGAAATYSTVDSCPPAMSVMVVVFAIANAETPDGRS